MKSFTATVRVAAVVVVSALLLFVTATAEENYTKHKEALFPQVEAGHALVYFARPDFMRLLPNPTFKVFVDAAPIGWLPQRSYLTAQVEPGNVTVWGPANDGQPFAFEGGKTYLLVLTERYGPNRLFVGASWRVFDPADIRPFVSDKKLSYVTSTDSSLAKLRVEGTKKFEKARE